MSFLSGLGSCKQAALVATQGVDSQTQTRVGKMPLAPISEYGCTARKLSFFSGLRISLFGPREKGLLSLEKRKDAKGNENLQANCKAHDHVTQWKNTRLP